MAPQSAIQRSLLAYVRTQEDQADHAGVKFLTATGQSAKGMLDLVQAAGQRSRCSIRAISILICSRHPMPPERVAALEALAKASPYFDRKDSPELQLRHDMMRAKLSGFLDRPDTVYAPLSARRPQPAGALCPRHLDLSPRQCAATRIAQIDGLIQTQPNNPYFYELKGQALLEGGHPAEAIAPLRRAVTLAHGAPLIDIMLGQALIATNNAKNAEEAVPLLRAALTREPEAPDAYAQLAMAYGRKGDLAQADLAAAQAAFNRGDIKTARAARRARQDPPARRLARLGARRRYRQRQAPPARSKTNDHQQGQNQ